MSIRRIMTFIFPLMAFLVTTSLSMAAENPKFKLKPGASGKICLNCHSAFQEKLKKPFVHTPVKSGECTGCHSPHTSNHGKLLAADVKKTCYLCHSKMSNASDKSVHKAVAEGNCAKCHDPHASANKFNLVNGGNDLCFQCHKDMGTTLSKVKFKHSPVSKGCLTCHDPHASKKNDFLLKSSVPELCAGCHRTEAPNFIKQHMNYPVAKTQCTGCHNPHGSDKRAILYDNVHAPVANKMCAQCHEDSSSPNPLKVKRTGIDLCKGCHANAVNEHLGKKRVHWPLIAAKGCLSCHSPHAAPGKGLIKEKQITLCGKCHADTIKRQEQSFTKHPPVMDGKCTTCHNPHASDELFLAKQGIVETCGKCHDWQRHSTHPIGEKYRDPRNKNLAVQCLSCHRSHGTPNKQFLHFPTTTDMCTQCHEQFKR